MAGLTTNPAVRGNKFKVYQEDAGKEHLLAKQLNLDKLMMLHGPNAKDYVDLTQIAKREAFDKLGKTLSKMRSPFTDMIQGTGGEIEVDKNYVQWRVYGDPDDRCMIYGNPNDPAEEYLGVNGTTFQIWVDRDFYSALDVLAPNHNKTVEVVVQSEFATPYEGGFLYDVLLKTDDPADFFDPIYFSPGEYFMKQGSLTSWADMAGSYGTLQLGDSFAYVEYRIPMTSMGWTFEVEGEAHRQYGSIAVMRCDDMDRPIMGQGGLTNYIETRAKMQIEYEKELAMIYGRMVSGMIDPKNGKQVTAGPGLYEFMEYGQEVPYSPETNGLDFMGEMFEGLWYDRIPTGEWDVELLTGQAGMRLFSSWVAEKFGATATITNYDFVLNSRTPFDNNYGRDGYAYMPPQFVEYGLPGYGRIRVSHWPALDDERLHGVKYPGSMYNVSSYEFIALNSGFGEPNVKKLVRKDNMYTGYQAGLWSPFGAVNLDNPYYKNPQVDVGDKYHYLHRETFGLLVQDPELIVRFRPNISVK